MIDRACDGEIAFDAIVVHSFSRFFRDAFGLEFYVRKLAKRGVRLLSITSNGWSIRCAPAWCSSAEPWNTIRPEHKMTACSTILSVAGILLNTHAGGPSDCATIAQRSSKPPRPPVISRCPAPLRNCERAHTRPAFAVRAGAWQKKAARMRRAGGVKRMAVARRAPNGHLPSPAPRYGRQGPKST